MRAQHAKVALDALIAAVDVLDARNARESVGLQARNHKRRARAKVCLYYLLPRSLYDSRCRPHH